MPGLIPYLWYEATCSLAHFACTLGFGLRTEGRNNIPLTGPVLILANHQSFLDPVLVGVSTRRHLSYLARKTLFRNPVFGRLLASLNAVPIDQEGIGKEGLKAILGQLQQGRAVLVFPEGTRTAHGAMNPFKPGVNLLISRAQAKIVPVGIAGAYDAWPVWRPYPIPAPLFLPATKRRIAVSVGEPIDSQQFVGLAKSKILDELFHKVKQLEIRADRLRHAQADT